MKQDNRLQTKLSVFSKRLSAIASAICFIPAVMAEDIIITQEGIDMGLFPTNESFSTGQYDNVTVASGTDYIIDVIDGSQRWQFINNGVFNIESGAYFKVSNSAHTESSGSTCINIAGTMNIAGEATFLRYGTSLYACGLFLAHNGYSYGPAGTVTVDNGGILRVYYTPEVGSVNEQATARVFIGYSGSTTSSKLVLKSGSTLVAQGVELYNGAALRVEKNASLYGNLAQTATTFVIVNTSASATIEFGDGANYKESILVKNDSSVTISFDELKDENVTIKSIVSYDNQEGNSTKVNFLNFANDYLILTDSDTVVINDEDGSILQIAAFSSSWEAMEAIFTAYNEEGTGFSDGWYFEEAYGDDGELLGVYLNNSNFPIPEPADFAFIFGALALVGVLAKRKR